jgi:hypothetical protein
LAAIDESGQPFRRRYNAQLAQHGRLTEGCNAMIEKNRDPSLADLRFQGQASELAPGPRARQRLIQARFCRGFG